MKIILGSGSAYRRKAMTDMGYDFEVVTADIDEKAIRHEDPAVLTLALAKAKAEAIMPKLSESAILITSDQVVACDGVIREKPVDEAQAREFLASYATHPAETVSAVMATNTATGRQESGVDGAKIYFKPLPESVIDALIADGDVFTKAGGFAAEDPLLAPYVDRIEGTLDSIGGLPKALTRQLIDKVSTNKE